MVTGAGWRRRLGAGLVVLAAATGTALAQSYPPPAYPQQGYPQQQQGYPQQQGYGQNPVCARLENQLGMINRGGDPTRNDQARRYEDAIARQSSDLDRMIAQARRLGCESNPLFSLFSNQPAECRPLNSQIQETRDRITRSQAEMQRVQGGGELESQKQTLIAALAQNNCGPQYQAAASQNRGLFGGLFGSNPALPSPDGLQASTFRTLCVRTCDGYYFPISFQTNQSRFADDEQTCQRLCPAAEVQLFTHRNPGEEVGQAVSLAGHSYRDLPTAFKYRTTLDQACTCRKPGQSWADALGVQKDNTIERGDIVVTEERSKAMAQPRTDAQGRPIRTERKPGTPAPAGAAAPSADASPTEEPRTGQIRSVGPTYVPGQAR
ncbi:DUF2865 domain-containing protein [Rhodoplanes roseus]|uniref:DUF2865 domain-containing protein n=1 Tax=Rhodoplanes roseus TaxID=29409 RepID=A0A327L158_9BRAD|nr:DUF2865 domain-containing protein [Rhodoplanes roseus]RAI43994.1 hypothetical protein CH341_11500 [Rhodoplanes roseus]